MKRILAIAALLAGTTAAAGATEILIYTGGAPTGEGSTYHNGMGVAVEEQLKELARHLRHEVQNRVPLGRRLSPTRKRLRGRKTENICFGLSPGRYRLPRRWSRATCRSF